MGRLRRTVSDSGSIHRWHVYIGHPPNPIGRFVTAVCGTAFQFIDWIMKVLDRSVLDLEHVGRIICPHHVPPPRRVRAVTGEVVLMF